MRLVIRKQIVNIVSAYAPQVGLSVAEKDDFWTGSKRHSPQAVKLSQRSQTAVQIVSNFPPQGMGALFTVYRQAGHPDPLALLLTKAGHVETNPGLTTLNTRV